MRNAACFLLFTAVLLSSMTVQARTTELPLSQRDATRNASTVELRQLQQINRVTLLDEDDRNAAPGVPLRFAVPSKMDVTPQTGGTWEQVKGGQLWRLRFEAQGATDLNFGFTDVYLGPGAKLWLVSNDFDYYQGSYTAADNKPHGVFYTPVVPGESATIELFVPSGDTETTLRLVQVARGYRDLFNRYETPQRSGSCNNDTICPEGDDWRKEIRSVARYSNAGLTLCTGQLVMDTDASFRPLFLSAFHCGITPANASQMVMYWNYESPVCGQLGGGSLDQNQSGATYIAGRDDVDFLLVELDAPPKPEWNTYWAGWDNSGDPVIGSVGIHHPSGDEKAISFNVDALTSVPNCTGVTPQETHWEVNNWEDGTTEGGSSGSAIWDPISHLVVGTLTGGSASCTSVTSDCYGKFSVSWDGLLAVERLRDHLDPSNTGATQMPGGEPANFVISTLDDTLGVCATGTDLTTLDVTVEGGFSDPITLSLSGLPAGVSNSFSPNPVNPPGASVLTLNVATAQTGSFPLVVTADAGTAVETLDLTLNLSKGIPDAPSTLFPADSATGVSPLQKLYWSAASNASTYRVEIATDSVFANIVETTGGIAGTSLERNAPLAENTTYHWRVVAESPCGDTVSAAASFTTSGAVCTIYPSADVPQTIPVLPLSVESQLTVSGLGGPVSDVNVVDLSGTHSWFNDLDFALQSPGATDVQIMARSCGNHDNFDLNLDDQAAPGSWPCPPVGGGTYQPSEPLAAYIGEDGNGTWTLTVTDNVAQDGGELQSWGLEICTVAPSVVLDTDSDGIEDDADNCRTDANADQCDTNGDGFGNLCDADITNDGIVNSFDLSAMRQQFGTSGPNDADLNCDNIVNSFDLSIMRQNFGSEPGPSGLVAP